MTDAMTYFGLNGFELWDTGGGCQAFGQRLDDDKHYVMLTHGSDGCEIPVANEPVMIGLYHEDNGHHIALAVVPYDEAVAKCNELIDAHLPK